MELQMKIEVFSTQNASPSKNYTLFKLLFEGCIAVFIGSTDSVERHEMRHFTVYFPTLLLFEPMFDIIPEMVIFQIQLFQN